MCVCVLHEADDEQQFGDAVQGEASGQMLMFWTLAPGLGGACHLFDPLDHLLVRGRGDGAQGLVQVLVPGVRVLPLLSSHRGVLHHFDLGGELVSLRALLQFGQLQL